MVTISNNDFRTIMGLLRQLQKTTDTSTSAKEMKRKAMLLERKFKRRNTKNNQ